jgi:hypothetical protein
MRVKRKRSACRQAGGLFVSAGNSPGFTALILLRKRGVKQLVRLFQVLFLGHYFQIF